MHTLVLRLLLTASCFCGATVGLAWLLRDQMFHRVPARCLEGHWEEGAASRRGFAILHLQYEWRGRVYDAARTFGPLDDSPRVRQTPADIQRGRNWIAANCRDQDALVMHGLPSIAWFGDQRSWNSVIAAVVLRSLVAAAAFSFAWTLVKRGRAAQ